MRAQVSLIPTESKKLIAKGIAAMEIVQKALKDGLIVMHPSSSTYFIVEELTGRKPPTNVWVCGAIVPKGACGEIGPSMGDRPLFSDIEESLRKSAKPELGSFPFCWVVRKGKFSTKELLGNLLEEMGPDDIYIKGVNALDVEGNAGVLWGNVVEGGSFGHVLATRRRKGFNLILPAGLEKLIPCSIKEAAKEAKRFEYDYAMGVSCGLLPCEGIVVTELKAVEILSGAVAVPISGGGIGGAEGAVTMVIKGENYQVVKAIQHAEESKGAILPPVRVANCHDCSNPPSVCTFRLQDKHWVTW